MKRLLVRVVLIVIVALAVAYLCDSALLRYRITKNRGYGTITVQRYYAIKQKTGKTEFSTADPEEVTCVHSLFPHQGYSPCWYVARHTEKEIDI